MPKSLPRRGGDKAAVADVPAHARPKICRILAQDVAALDGSSKVEGVAGPAVVGAETVAVQSPAELADHNDSHLVPDALKLHLGDEAREGRVHLTKELGQIGLSVRVRIEAPQFHRKNIPLGFQDAPGRNDVGDLLELGGQDGSIVALGCSEGLLEASVRLQVRGELLAAHYAVGDHLAPSFLHRTGGDVRDHLEKGLLEPRVGSVLVERYDTDVLVEEVRYRGHSRLAA
mmetsp:Transcript_7726/g.13974  ORF Transcript_7726/g.13974 Transcript_7726/m.13974 type:complete len:230 (-) Transcript_7726:3278-3967(-)